MVSSAERSAPLSQTTRQTADGWRTPAPGAMRATRAAAALARAGQGHSQRCGESLGTEVRSQIAHSFADWVRRQHGRPNADRRSRLCKGLSSISGDLGSSAISGTSKLRQIKDAMLSHASKMLGSAGRRLSHGKSCRCIRFLVCCARRTVRCTTPTLRELGWTSAQSAWVVVRVCFWPSAFPLSACAPDPQGSKSR